VHYQKISKDLCDGGIV